MALSEGGRIGLRARITAVGISAGLATVALLASFRTIQAQPAAFGLDLPAYVEGAKRLMATGSPYSEAIHNGPIEHFAANIPIAYLYPPPLAQIFVPLTFVPFPLLAAAWAASQTMILGALLLAVFRHFGGQVDWWSASVILLCAAAFQPTSIAIFIGNVSGWIAIAVALMLLGGVRAVGASSAMLLWLKVTPGPLAIGAIIDRATRKSAAIAILLIALVSFVLSPFAWVDFLAILPSLVAMPAAEIAINVSPSNVIRAADLGGPFRLVPPVLVAGFLLLTYVNAARGRRLAWVASACGVYLCLSSTVWHQYMVVLVPVAVAVWPRASNTVRGGIVLTLLWYGPLWQLASEPLYQLMGLVLWVVSVVAIAVSPHSGVARLDIVGWLPTGRRPIGMGRS